LFMLQLNHCDVQDSEKKAKHHDTPI